MGDDTLGPAFVGCIVGVLFVTILVIFLKTRLCGGIKDCLCDICSKACYYCMCCLAELYYCDSDKCFKCVSCICLSPCLFVNWLRREYNERTHQNEQFQTTQNREDTSDIPVVTVQPVSPPIQQTNINISIHHGDSRRSLTDYNFSEIDDDYIEGHISMNTYALGSGWTLDGVILPPSYDEATKNDPPSYQEAHKYSASQS